jgi:hypothetical protein
MTELKEIIEEWATKYKPMQHTIETTGNGVLVSFQDEFKRSNYKFRMK